MDNRSVQMFLNLESDLLSQNVSLEREPAPEADIKRIASYQLLKSVLKKYAPDGSAEADRKALDKFLEMNNRCGTWSVAIPENELEAVAYGHFRELVTDFFYTPWHGTHVPILDLEKILRNGRVGPGSSVGAEGTSMYLKLCASALSTTSDRLYAYYEHAVANSNTWSEAEMLRALTFGDFELTRGNVLSFVPKNADISRTICTEPLLNMFFQQGIAAVFTEQLQRIHGIDFHGRKDQGVRSQPEKNRELARIGSITEQFGTIDLSSASDTIATELCREILPPEVFRWLDLTRSPECLLPNGRWCTLNMLSSMGNAFTFPLQTIIFTSVVLGCYKALGITAERPHGDRLGNFGVFGDDIIVVRKAYNLVMRLLEMLGFLPNPSKSYNDGWFRESCGGDYYRGTNVRGVYCTSLRTKQDVWSLFNRLSHWSVRHDVPLCRTLRYLSQCAPRRPVPLWANIDAGIRVPYAFRKSSYFQPLKYDRNTGSPLAEFSVARTKSLDVADVGEVAYIADSEVIYYDDGEPIEVIFDAFLHNPPGLLMCAAAGHLRRGRLPFRERPSYQTRVKPCPGWDEPDASDELVTRQGAKRLNLLLELAFLG